MSDRYQALTVILSEDMRDDDAESLIAAIRNFKGVADVLPSVSDISATVGRIRARDELGKRLMELVYGELR